MQGVCGTRIERMGTDWHGDNQQGRQFFAGAVESQLHEFSPKKVGGWEAGPILIGSAEGNEGASDYESRRLLGDFELPGRSTADQPAEEYAKAILAIAKVDPEKSDRRWTLRRWQGGAQG